jgi:predicted TIM-barrel fold metal-dependent hydrolase
MDRTMADIEIIDPHHHLYDRGRNASPMMENGTIVHDMWRAREDAPGKAKAAL